MQPLKTLNSLNLPDLSENSLQIHECYWFVCQKNLRIFYGAPFPPKFNVPFYIVLYTICPTFCACLSFEFALAIQLFCIQHSTSIYMQHSSFRFRHSTFHKQQSRFRIRPSSSVECTFIFSHAAFSICPLVFASDIRLWALYLQVSAFDIQLFELNFYPLVSDRWRSWVQLT